MNVPKNRHGSQADRYAGISGWLLILLGLPLWELIRRVTGVSSALMPSVAEILSAFRDGLITGMLPYQIAVSCAVILSGAATALVLAVGSILAASASRTIDSALNNLGALMHPLPGIVLLPVIVLWFGIGFSAVLVVIVHSVFWPVLTNLRAGYRSIPPTWRMVARNYRITGIRYIATVALPATAPYLLAGLRIAWARAWRALISAEMLFGAVAAGGGLGWYIHSRRVFMDSAGLFAGILVVMCIGTLVENLFFSLLEKSTVRRWGMSV
jgi:NitT/TauT family transport system permease protein